MLLHRDAHVAAVHVDPVVFGTSDEVNGRELATLSAAVVMQSTERKSTHMTRVQVSIMVSMTASPHIKGLRKLYAAHTSVVAAIERSF